MSEAGGVGDATGRDGAQREHTPQERDARRTEWSYRCDLCGAPMQEWHCRIICNFCGYQRDCSDP